MFSFTKQFVKEYAEYLEKTAIKEEAQGLFIDATRHRESAESTQNQLQRIESGEVEACHTCKTMRCQCS